MNIKQLIEDDLKKSLLSGDKETAGTLKVIKSAILDSEIAKNKRESGLEENEMIDLLQKEVKKRQDTAEIYDKAGDKTRQQQELKEIVTIKKYLPEQMDDDEIKAIITEITGGKDIEQKQMGQVIGQVKQKTEGRADGSVIARLVKEVVSQ